MKSHNLTIRALIVSLYLVGASTSNAATAPEVELQKLLLELAEQRSAIEHQQTELEKQREELQQLRALIEGQSRVTELVETSVAGMNAVESSTAQKHVADSIQGLEISGYGVMAYHNRDWETDEFAKDTIDTERFILELEYAFNDRWSAKAEIEYEHGGTGVTLELDSQEEFGEFEQEVEAGGEVLIEELFVAYRHADWLNAKVGRFYVPMGRTNKRHKPQDYFTVARSDSDASMIPQLWHESGISLFGTLSLGKWGDLAYESQLVNGLDSTGFSSRNWVARGHQKRFEEARTEDFAMLARLDYHISDDFQLGAAWYGGNTTDNRPKNDLDVDAFIDIFGFDGEWTPGNFILRGQYLWGRLQNSHLVSDANRILSNNLNVKRTPVGSEAQSWFVEAGYDVLADDPSKLILFGRYDQYDSMYRTEGLVFDNPRWERKSWTLGINYLPISNLIFKAEYNARELNIDTTNSEDTFSLGVGFNY